MRADPGVGKVEGMRQARRVKTPECRLGGGVDSPSRLDAHFGAMGMYLAESTSTSTHPGKAWKFREALTDATGCSNHQVRFFLGRPPFPS
jgi:hypothetical protein